MWKKSSEQKTHWSRFARSVAQIWFEDRQKAVQIPANTSGDVPTIRNAMQNLIFGILMFHVKENKSENSKNILEQLFRVTRLQPEVIFTIAKLWGYTPNIGHAQKSECTSGLYYTRSVETVMDGNASDAEHSTRRKPSWTPLLPHRPPDSNEVRQMQKILRRQAEYKSHCIKMPSRDSL